MKHLVGGAFLGAFGVVQVAAAAPIVELRTNPACAAAYAQTVHALGQFVEVGKRLNAGNPPTAESCRNARQAVSLQAAHYRLEARMFATCHQDGSAELAGEAARNEHLRQTIIPRYCR